MTARLFYALHPSGTRRELVADDEVEAQDLLSSGEVLLVPLSDREAAKRRLDHRMMQRVRRDEEERARREDEARRRFVDALVGPEGQTRGWVED